MVIEKHNNAVAQFAALVGPSRGAERCLENKAREEHQARPTFQPLVIEIVHEILRRMLYLTIVNVECVYCTITSTMSDSIRSLSSFETACKSCVETRVQKHHIDSRGGTGRHQIPPCPQVQYPPVHSNFSCMTFPEDLKQSSRFVGTHTQN